MNLDDFDYPLPPELIAQEPASPRDQSRLMVLNRQSGSVFHDRFCHFPEYVRPGDTVVLNDTKVWPARLLGNKESGVKSRVFSSAKGKGIPLIRLLSPLRKRRPANGIA